MNIKNINDYIFELERKVQDLEKTVEDYGNRIADASFTLYDWDGYYDEEALKGNADNLAALIEDAFVILQGKPWLETPLRERLEMRGDKPVDVEGQMRLDFDQPHFEIPEPTLKLPPIHLDPNIKLPPLVKGFLEEFVGDNDHGDAVPPPPLTPEDIMMRNQELTNENFDLKMKMQMVEARAIRAEKRYERMKEHGARMRIAEFIVASEPFMWLMAGSNYTESNLKALRPAYDKWKESGGLPDMMARINKKQREALDNLSKLDEELGLYEPKKEEESNGF
jgi:hypothetical protein